MYLNQQYKGDVIHLQINNAYIGKENYMCTKWENCFLSFLQLFDYITQKV